MTPSCREYPRAVLHERPAVTNDTVTFLREPASAGSTTEPHQTSFASRRTNPNHNGATIMTTPKKPKAHPEDAAKAVFRMITRKPADWSSRRTSFSRT